MNEGGCAELDISAADLQRLAKVALIALRRVSDSGERRCFPGGDAPLRRPGLEAAAITSN